MTTAPPLDVYTVVLTRAQLDLVATGLVELPAKHVMELLRYLHDQMAQIDAQRQEPVTRDAPA